MQAKPQAEHQWLDQLVGDWTYESQCSMGPDQPEIKTQGSESVRSLGGMWVLCEGRGKMPDGDEASMIISLGYDPQQKKYVGTFIGSVMSHLWIYKGSLDSTGKILTLDTEGPSFAEEGKLAKYQDIIEIVDKNHRTLSSQTQGPDGNWVKFMTMHYRRGI
jgi:hypothetical protein